MLSSTATPTNHAAEPPAQVTRLDVRSASKQVTGAVHNNGFSRNCLSQTNGGLANNDRTSGCSSKIRGTSINSQARPRAAPVSNRATPALKDGKCRIASRKTLSPKNE